MVVVAIHFLGLKSQLNVQYRNQYRNQTNNNPTTPVAKTNCITDLGPASFHSQGEGQESGQLKLTIDKFKATVQGNWSEMGYQRIHKIGHMVTLYKTPSTTANHLHTTIQVFKILSKGGSLKAYIGSVKKLVPLYRYRVKHRNKYVFWCMFISSPETKKQRLGNSGLPGPLFIEPSPHKRKVAAEQDNWGPGLTSSSMD